MSLSVALSATSKKVNKITRFAQKRGVLVGLVGHRQATTR